MNQVQLKRIKQRDILSHSEPMKKLNYMTCQSMSLEKYYLGVAKQ